MKRYIVRQKITFLTNQYEIYEAGEDGEQLVAFAQQKRLALKERITFYADTNKSSVLFDVKARNVMELGAKYDVVDTDGSVIGTIGKAFGQSFISSTWHIFSSGDESAPKVIVEESNIGVAILRRLWDFLPFVDYIPFFIKYHFDFKRPGGGEVAATYRKTALLRDHYELAIEDESLLAEHDWRTFVAVGVMLDALQSR
ncbi:MAG TPA: hypothetical protein VK983_02415 [Candidatus Limnocylindrales bacterium]|nr:hypothetical protein [Candidatus Limnocylindrales bacterium]